MTTTVIVKCISSNPDKGAIATDTNGNVRALAPGDEATFYLHDGNILGVVEGEVQVTAETQVEVPPDPAPEDETTG